MTDLNHWKNLESIEPVVAFNAKGEGPVVTQLHFIVNAHPSKHYPEARIIIGIPNLSTVCLTLAQLDDLRARLDLAEHLVRTGTADNPVTPATGTEGGCADCMERIVAGQRITVSDDEEVVHAPCPSSEGRCDECDPSFTTCFNDPSKCVKRPVERDKAGGCEHRRTERGKDIPRRHGSFRSEVCLDCKAFRARDHHDEIVTGYPGRWRPAEQYASDTADTED